MNITEVLDDIEHVVKSVAEEVENTMPGCRAESTVMLVHPYNRARIRMVVHGGMGENSRIERIEDVRLDQLADEMELFYLLGLCEIGHRFRRTMGSQL